MRRVLIQYTVHADRVAENEEQVRAVYAELHRTRPTGIRYGTFRLADGVSFVHLASVETDDGRNPLSEVAAFARFQAGVGDRCVSPAVVTELDEVGSYRLLGDEPAS